MSGHSLVFLKNTKSIYTIIITYHKNIFNEKHNYNGCLLFSLTAYSQVGINTNNPKASLDISAKTTDGSKPEGLIAPRLTGDQIRAGDNQYGTAQKGAILYATSAVTSPSTKTANITAEGYYFFDGTSWQKITGAASAGDTTNDAWINDTANSMVKLGTKSDGTARTAGTDVVVNDAGQMGLGTSSPANKLDINGDGINNPVRIRNVLSEAINEQNFNLVLNANGEIKKSQRSSTPMYFQKYILSNVNADWVENYDTKIPSNKYTLVVVGANFPYTLSAAGGTTIEAYILGGTWRLRADFLVQVLVLLSTERGLYQHLF
ncbi:hypothetical protein [Chryseobacterium cheonjiense]|uniref:Uncharacterized protein n=1 Tax=Chryseobacterium cheonjiense TaxID=2728845 RepID=A0A7Y0AAF6_9FLAO|nr:hypothetical protein [Chryseobacterium cheonjiense]NML59386.1 hypothetical protein [Chryseobacterium cheonjiense]